MKYRHFNYEPRGEDPSFAEQEEWKKFKHSSLASPLPTTTINEITSNVVNYLKAAAISQINE